MLNLTEKGWEALMRAYDLVLSPEIEQLAQDLDSQGKLEAQPVDRESINGRAPKVPQGKHREARGGGVRARCTGGRLQ